MTRAHRTARWGQPSKSSKFWALPLAASLPRRKGEDEETSQRQDRGDSFPGTAWTGPLAPRPRSVGPSCKSARCGELCFIHKISRRIGVMGITGVLRSVHEATQFLSMRWRRVALQPHHLAFHKRTLRPPQLPGHHDRGIKKQRP